MVFQRSKRCLGTCEKSIVVFAVVFPCHQSHYDTSLFISWFLSSKAPKKGETRVARPPVAKRSSVPVEHGFSKNDTMAFHDLMILAPGTPERIRNDIENTHVERFCTARLGNPHEKHVTSYKIHTHKNSAKIFLTSKRNCWQTSAHYQVPFNFPGQRTKGSESGCNGHCRSHK